MGFMKEAAFGRRVLVDYMSPEGPVVFGVKAFVFSHRRAYLRETGHYDEYARLLGAHHEDVFASALASSWIPMETVIAHYAALDALGAGDTLLTRSTEALAPTIYETFFAALLRLVRSRDVDHPALAQADRVVSRIYRGGGVTVTLTGAKDVLYELKGVPFANSHSFRLAHCEFLRSALKMTVKACTVRELTASCPRAENYSVLVSWA